MERRAAPQIQPRPPRFLLADAVVDRLPNDGYLQIAVAVWAAAICLPWLGLPEPVSGFLSFGALPALLLLTALRALRTGRARVEGRFEQRFWQDLQLMGGFLLGAILLTNGFWTDSPWPDLIGRLLLLVAYALLLLASETQPHREEIWRSVQLERRLSLLTVIALGVGLFGYFAFTPSIIQGRLQPVGVPVAFLFTILAALITARFVSLGAQVEDIAWRSVYRALAGSALCLLGFHVTQTVDPATIGQGTTALRIFFFVGAGACFVTAVRLRHHPFPADWKPAEPGVDPIGTEPITDPVQESRLGLEFRTLILALAVPLMHFLGYRIDLFAEAYEEVREIWMLFWAATLGGLAYTQQHLSGGRLLAILNEQRRIQKTLAAGDRRMQMISERKQADEALYYSREKYAKAFRSCPYALTIVTRRDGRHLEANEQYLAMLGLKSDDLYTLRFPDLISEDDGSRWRALDRQLKRQGRLRGYEVPLRDQKGRERRIELSADSLEVDDELCMVAICRDLSLEEERQEVLRRQNQTFDFCESSLVVIDAAGRLVQANPAGRAALDRSPKLDENESLFDTFFVRTPELHAADLATLEGRNWMGRLPALDHDGPRIFNCWWMPLRGSDSTRKNRLILVFPAEQAGP